MIASATDWSALGWHCMWLSVGGLFTVLFFCGAVAQLAEPFPDSGAAVISAVIGIGLGFWVISSARDPERPLRGSIEPFRIQRAEAKRREAISGFLERYHPALKAGYESVQRLHTEASEDLRDLQGLQAELKHDKSILEIGQSITDMKRAEAELARALERIEVEVEELYAVHQLEQIAGEGWTPGAVDRMRRSAEATIQMAQVANQEAQQLDKTENERNKP